MLKSLLMLLIIAVTLFVLWDLIIFLYLNPAYWEKFVEILNGYLEWSQQMFY